MNEQALVVDIGSCSYKAGFSGDDEPKLVGATLVGRSKSTSSPLEYIGDGALAMGDILNYKYPVEQGYVWDWIDYELIFCDIQTRLATFNERPVLVSECALNPKANREKITQILFESLSFPAMYSQVAGVLAMYAAGKTFGVSVDVGHDVTSVVPVYEGYQMIHGIRRTEVAGHQISDKIAQVLRKCGCVFSPRVEREVIDGVKDKLYVASDFEMEKQNYCREYTCELPDGNMLSLETEKYEFPEILFQPRLIDGMETVPGVSQSTYDAVTSLDVDLRVRMLNNVVVSGGSSLFTGFVERLHEDLLQLAPVSNNIMIANIPKEQRKQSAWIGGSILSCLNGFISMCIRQEEYEEYGPTIVHRRCL